MFGLLGRHGRIDDAILRSTTGSSWAQAEGPSGQDPSLVTWRERGSETWHIEVESLSSSSISCSKCKGEKLGLRDMAEGSPVGNWMVKCPVGYTWDKWAYFVLHSHWDGELQDGFGRTLFFLLVKIWSGFRHEFAVSECWTAWLSSIYKVVKSLWGSAKWEQRGSGCFAWTSSSVLKYLSVYVSGSCPVHCSWWKSVTEHRN